MRRSTQFRCLVNCVWKHKQTRTFACWFTCAFISNSLIAPSSATFIFLFILFKCACVWNAGCNICVDPPLRVEHTTAPNAPWSNFLSAMIGLQLSENRRTPPTMRRLSSKSIHLGRHKENREKKKEDERAKNSSTKQQHQWFEKRGKRRRASGLVTCAMCTYCQPRWFFLYSLLLSFRFSFSLFLPEREREREMRCCHTPTVHTER